VRAGFAAQFIAEDVAADSGLFFTAGLLHDIGKVILAEAFKEAYARVVSEAKQSGRPLTEVEEGAFGVDHAAIGGRLLAHWKFSAELVASVGCHHHPRAALTLERSAAYVQLASAVASEENFNPQPETSAVLGLEEGLAILGWTTPDLARYSERLIENMAFVEGMVRQGG
jgi:putative nucleotidyltransferase with HDIG domain